MNRARILQLLFAAVVVVVTQPSCNKDKTGVGADLAAPDLTAPGDLAGAVDEAVPGDMVQPPDLAPPPCTSEITSCAGLCGKVTDSCTGTVFQCGGCEGMSVCSLDTHACEAPKLDCADFGAECGEVKNSCGKRFFCGYCLSGKECDPDTRKCVDCTGVTCQDVGYECGRAWLGCGSRDNDADYTDCGTCPDGKVCNETSHICEPSCTPPTTADEIAAYCAQKKTEKGVECGLITDGCGGEVNCGGCPAGKKCGTRGVANRCDANETPIECQALGKTCGTLTSACDATLVYCGDCPDGQVCNDNGVCGPPCVPKTCAELLAGAECGNFADDGCGAPATCSCGANSLCDGTGHCKPILACADYTNGGVGMTCSNGSSSAFPKGDGTNLDCRCTGNLLCVNDLKDIVAGDAAGSCCQDTGAKCSGTDGLNGPCNSLNTCTEDTAGCCKNANRCDDHNGSATKDKCITKCAYYDATGTAGKKCSTTSRSYFENVNCPCNGGLTCVGETGAMAGTCCQNSGPSCSGTDGIGGPCQVTNTCTSAMTNCCGATAYCDGGTSKCVAKKTCATYNANGDNGNICSRGPSSSFPEGDGVNLTCNCDAGFACADGSNVLVPTDGTTGHCIPVGNVVPPTNQQDCVALGGFFNDALNPKCCFGAAGVCKNDSTDCGKTEPHQCAAYGAPPTTCQACGCEDFTIPAGSCSTGGNNSWAPGLTCGCGAGNTCFKLNTQPSGKTNDGKCCPNSPSPGQVLGTNDMCTTKLTCATIADHLNVAQNMSGATDAGKKCNDNNFYDNGTGGNGDFSCKCSTSGGFGNQQCTGDSSSVEGSCTCVKTTCDCTNGGASDGCGGTVTCCALGKVCKSNGAICCDPQMCPSDWHCGNFLDSCSGQNRNCGTCDSAHFCDGTHNCAAKKTCADYLANGQIGDPCGNTFDDGSGTNTKLTCGCDTSGGKTNNTCSMGTCKCTKSSCVGLTGDQPDGCGGTHNCGG